MVGGRPLTMHEAIIPQSACEMLEDRDWVVPKSGGRPWLERPPLPQWITVAVISVVGRCDQEWIGRLSPAVIGTGVVLLLAWMASIWFGRSIGLLSGFILATMFEFTRYAWLAEEDIFLCGLVISAIALFVYQEFTNHESQAEEKSRFLGGRPWPILAFFVMLGLTNLAKGPFFGAVLVLVPILGFIAWNWESTQIGRYCWFWGWAVFVLIAGAWPIAVWYRFPDVVDLWAFDYVGRIARGYMGEPVWYYPLVWTWVIAPWTFVGAVGLWLTWKKAFASRFSLERFLWCWALVPIAVLSIPDGKHHHYLLSSIAPWAIFGALGLRWCYNQLCHLKTLMLRLAPAFLFLGPIVGAAVWISGVKIPGPQWLLPSLIIGIAFVLGSVCWAIARKEVHLMTTIILLGTVVVYCLGYTYVAPISDQSLQDTEFLRQVRFHVTSEKPLMVNADLDSMDIFRILFYLQPLQDQVKPVHNLTFLRDDHIHDAEIYVITRFKDRPKLEKLGTSTVLLKSEKTRREHLPGDRFTLFELKFHDNLVRRPAPSYISPLQAMERESGPFIGEQL